MALYRCPTSGSRIGISQHSLTFDSPRCDQPMNKQSERALIALRKILKATEANVKALAARSGLTASQLLALQALHTGGEMLIGDLARMLDVSHATISILLDKLQDMDLVTRQRDDEDRRKVWVRISDAGSERLLGAPDLLQNRFRRRYSRLPDWEQTMLLAALQRVVSLLDADEIDASPVLDIGNIAELPPKEADA